MKAEVDKFVNRDHREAGACCGGGGAPGALAKGIVKPPPYRKEKPSNQGESKDACLGEELRIVIMRLAAYYRIPRRLTIVRKRLGPATETDAQHGVSAHNGERLLHQQKPERKATVALHRLLQADVDLPAAPRADEQQRKRNRCQNHYAHRAKQLPAFRACNTQTRGLSHFTRQSKQDGHRDRRRDPGSTREAQQESAHYHEGRNATEHAERVLLSEQIRKKQRRILSQRKQHALSH